MTTVLRWSGREVRALREAKRMSLREFAAHLGVSDRMISKWEAGGDQARPRPVNQAALDTSLSQSPRETQARFTSLTGLPGDPSANPPAAHASVNSSTKVVRHPIDGKHVTLVEAGVFLGGVHEEPAWLDAFYIDVHPVSNAEYARFVAATSHRTPRH